MRFNLKIYHLLLIAAITVWTGYNSGNLPAIGSDQIISPPAAAYLTDSNEKTVINYAIIESGPSADLGKDEVYIEHLNTVYNPDNALERDAADLYPAAPGVFIDSDTTIPENLVSIENPNTLKVNNTNTAAALTKSSAPATPGEFISDESGGLTAETPVKDRFQAFAPGAFTIGYQLQYLNIHENGSNSEIIYNGIKAKYHYENASDTVIEVTASLLGGKKLNEDYGSIYSDNRITAGQKFELPAEGWTITPYFGIALRYLNNVFADSDTFQSDELQLYVPFGLQTDCTTAKNLHFFVKTEVAPIAFTQSWRSTNQGKRDYSAAFNGINALFEMGLEYSLNAKLTIGITPYYQYTYVDNKASESDSSDTHAAGLNLYLNF